MWGMTCECQPQHQILHLALRAPTCLVVAEFGSASRATRPWRIVSDCLEQIGKRGLAKRLLEHALVVTFVKESAIVAEYFWREANYIWNSQSRRKH